MTSDAIYALAKNIVGTNYEDLPSDVVEVTKKEIMDSFAVAIAGSSAPSVAELVEILKEWGGKKESSIWVYGGQLPCIFAAQVNSTMIHARDFDDTHDAAVLHPSSPVISTAFAISERLGNVDGKKLITAVALAVDMAARLCLASTIPMFELGWHYTTSHGSLGATAVAGKLLELDEESLVNAFGIAYHQTGGNIQCFEDGALTKRCGPGFAARNGIMAVVMAKKGITGARNVLQGPHGLYNQYHKGNYKPEILTKDLGKKFEGINVSFKPYPCCRYTHVAIDATSALLNKHNIKADDIDKVIVHVGKSAYGLVCQPLDAKQNPRNLVDTQFSIPWAVACTIDHGKVTLADITQEATKNKAILNLSNKVVPELDDTLSRTTIEPCLIELHGKDGRIYSEYVDNAYGCPDNPISMDGIIEKLWD
ncbi:MAG: MmgE/PrpD family protein, partial [Candidatus Omnitrophica bacterium]|nr:MmgE/PrpD family protein [Candidatus Omnitrophota bacterium]